LVRLGGAKSLSASSVLAPQFAFNQGRDGYTEALGFSITCDQLTEHPSHQVCSLRFSDALTGGIKGSELVIFETCAHAPIYQSTAEFNKKTLKFLNQHTG
jgi:hypothetical protein